MPAEHLSPDLMLDVLPGVTPGSNPNAATAWLEATGQTELLRFTTAGSVDDGKSTLIGRLLYDSKGVYLSLIHI